MCQFVCYTPYGEAFVDEHSTSYEHPFKFSGKELDDVTGLYDHGARSRVPKTIIWYGIDKKIDDYPNFSPYSYCAGNPVKLVDPDGEAFWAVGAAIGGAIVGATVSGVIAALDPDKNATEVIAATVGGAVSGAIAAGGASVGAAMVSGAAGAAAGNAVEQSINIFFGNQEEFDVKSTAIAAGTGAVCNAGSKYVGNKIETAAKNKIGEIASEAKVARSKVGPNKDYKETQRAAQRKNIRANEERINQINKKVDKINKREASNKIRAKKREYLKGRLNDITFSSSQNFSQSSIDNKKNSNGNNGN